MTEQEVDLRRYWSAVTARWWLPVLGLVAGAAIGYALSLGGSDVWRGNALVYLGQPVTPSGAQVQSLSTNPATAGEIAGSGAAQRRVERAVGMRRGELARHRLGRRGRGQPLAARPEPARARPRRGRDAQGRAGRDRARARDRRRSLRLRGRKIAVLEDGGRADRGRPRGGARRRRGGEALLWRAELNSQLLLARSRPSRSRERSSARASSRRRSRAR